VTKPTPQESLNKAQMQLQMAVAQRKMHSQQNYLNGLGGYQQSSLGSLLERPSAASDLLSFERSYLGSLLNAARPSYSPGYATKKAESWADDAAKAYDRLTLWIEFYKIPLLGVLFAPIVVSIASRLERCVENAESWLESAAA
jgi:hypothetical protein